MITFTLEMTEAEAKVLIDALVVARDAAQSLGRLTRAECGLLAAEVVGVLAIKLRRQLDAATIGVAAS